MNKWIVEFVETDDENGGCPKRGTSWVWEGEACAAAEAVRLAVDAVIEAKEFGGRWRVLRVTNATLAEKIFLI